MRDFGPFARSRPTARCRPRSYSLRRMGLVAAGVLLFSSYATGVSYGHWAVQAYAEPAIGTGTLALQVTDPPPDLTIHCTSGACDTASGRIDLTSVGSTPAGVAVELGYDGGADPSQCALFDVQLSDRGASLFAGALCDLLASPAPVMAQLDPGDSLALDFTVALHPGAVPTTPVTLPLLSWVTWWQWASGPPGSSGAYGWWGSVDGAFDISVALLPAQPAPVAGAGGEDPAPSTLPPPGETATNTTAGPTPATTTTTTLAPTTTEAPATTSTTSATPTVAPPDETSTTTSATLPPAGGGEEGLLTLRGRAWEDLDGDGATVRGHAAAEPPVAGVRVSVLDTAGQVVVRTRTSSSGRYEVEGLAPGRYRVTFTAPESFGFRDPQRPVTVAAQQMADLLGIGLDQVVLDDLDRVSQTNGEPPLWRASTEFFEAGPGLEDQAADAAMARLPEEAPGAFETGDGASAPPSDGLPSDQVAPVEEPPATTDPNTQAAKPEEPTPQTTPPVPDQPPPEDQAAPEDPSSALADSEGAMVSPQKPGPGGGAAVPGEGEGSVP